MFKKITPILISSIIAINFAYADTDIVNNPSESVNREYTIHLDEPTIAKGYTVSAFDDNLKLSLVPGILSEDTNIDVMELNEELDTPWQVDRISKVYQFEFKNKAAYDNHKPFYIQFSYNEPTDYYKQVFFYDKNFSSWRPLPTKDFPNEKFVRSLIHLPFARIAVFSNKEAMTIGKASWYKYKGGDFAASPDFPKGSKVRVWNNENGKFVDVTINDWGPGRDLHPDRVIDLDKVAFAKIASTGAGIIDARVEPINIIPESDKILNISDSGAGTKPNITAKSAIAINEKTNEIILEKNATTTLPLASLTKLVAIKTFLDTRPSLDKIVIYNSRDEEYNYEYCNKWESARLKVEDGDSMTIEDLLYASLVGSANNAIETLVRVSGMSRDDFIKKMNDNAKEWGASSTYFIEPTGLSPENVSSALDYAIITKEIYTHPIIQKASTMAEYKFSTINTEKKFNIKNTNKLIAANTFDIAGSKTGYLDEAGYCLMTRAKIQNGDFIISVIMGSDTRETSFEETKDLIKYGIRSASRRMAEKNK